MWQLKSYDFSIDRLLLEESLFSIGNGYIGIRGCFEEAPMLYSNTIRGSYINGYYDQIPIMYGESAYGFPGMQDKQPRVMDTQTVLVFLDGEAVVIEASKIKDYVRILDLKKGFSERSYTYITQKGKEGQLVFRRMASLALKHLLCFEIDVHYEGDIELVSILDSDVSNYCDSNDPRVGAGHSKLLNLKYLSVNDDLVSCEMETITSKLPLLSSIQYNAESEAGECIIRHNLEERRANTIITGKGHIKLQKKCVFFDGLRSMNLYKDSSELLAEYKDFSFNDMKMLQQDYLKRFWESSDIEIYGNDKIQEAIRYQLFQLLQSVGRDEISNISAKGLSGEGYEGHYFWDTEIYVLPLFQLTQPDLAKQLLLYRYHILESAKLRARELGHKKGAAYPWRTISGIECSSYFPAGTAQYHINADIAYGFIQYYLYHKDRHFMLEAAAEVIFETARIWLEIGHWHNNAFRIDCVTGPDEYTAIVNNNYYTNIMAKYHMYWAHKLYHELQEFDKMKFEKLCSRIDLTAEEVDNMRRASQNMHLPYDMELDIYAQDDSFLSKAVWDFAGTKEEQYPLLLHFHPLTIYRYQVLKQADTVLANLLLEDYADFAAMKKSYDYYERLTTHDSSLSCCIYGIMASKFGYMQKAYDYFMEAVSLDLDDKHGNTKDGLHMANLAGSCLSIIYGFAGYRIKEKGITLSPILPKELEGYCFRVRYLDSCLEIKVKEKIYIKLLQGKPVKLSIYEKDYLILDITEVERKQV